MIIFRGALVGDDSPLFGGCKCRYIYIIFYMDHTMYTSSFSRCVSIFRRFFVMFMWPFKNDHSFWGMACWGFWGSKSPHRCPGKHDVPQEDTTNSGQAVRYCMGEMVLFCKCLDYQNVIWWFNEKIGDSMILDVLYGWFLMYVIWWFNEKLRKLNGTLPTGPTLEISWSDQILLKRWM